MRIYGDNAYPYNVDEHFSPRKQKELSADKLIELLEKVRRKSVWNMFLVNDIDEPITKLIIKKNNRNKVAHCGNFDTYFDGNEGIKKTFIDGITKICDDGQKRFFVPEVNSALKI